jgi:fumarate reductase subunit D
MILIFRDWRWSLIALLVQYLVVGLLYADVMPAHMAFTRILVGAFVCLILYITARQVNWGRIPEDVAEEEEEQLTGTRLLLFGIYSLTTDIPFRIFLALLVALSIWAVAHRIELQLPALPTHINLAVISLVGMGIVTTALTSEPMKSGIGILTFLIGFELFYGTVEQSAVMLALSSIAMLIVSVAIAYLIQARHNFRALLN